METQVNRIEPQSGRFPQAVIWIAGIALTLFCGVGIAALMGWIPSSLGISKDKAALAQQQSANTVPAVAPVIVPAVAPKAPRAAAAHPAAVAHTTHAQGAPDQVAGYTGHASCTECGVIESVREIDAKGSGSGLGVVGGGVLGGLLGNQVGAGRGKDVMTVVGVVGGAVAGNEVEKRVKTTKRYEVTVRLNDGSSRVIGQASLPVWRTGDKVKVVNGAIQSDA